VQARMAVVWIATRNSLISSQERRKTTSDFPSMGLSANSSFFWPEAKNGVTGISSKRWKVNLPAKAAG
jgi:hypothetical protein